MSFALACVSVLVVAGAAGMLLQALRGLSASPSYLAFVGGVVLGSVLLHVALCALFRVDRDTMMITSTAAVFGPPFVPMVARSLDNPRLLLGGITTGLVGYAVGNYLGLALFYLPS